MKEIETIKKINIKNTQTLVKHVLENKLEQKTEMIYTYDTIKFLAVNSVAIYKMYDSEFITNTNVLGDCYNEENKYFVEFMQKSYDDIPCIYTKEIKQIGKIQGCKFASVELPQLQIFYDYNYLKPYLHELNNFNFYFKKVSDKFLFLCVEDPRDEKFYCFGLMPIVVDE